jgi:uncharacterized protein (DUF2267 family)
MVGVHEFDDLLQDANAWLRAVMEQLKTEDAHVGHTALKATLHVIRDRIPPDSAVHLGGQLPTLIRGIFYENWHMAGKPTKERHLEPFLDHLAREIPQRMRLDPEDAACAVFEVMSDRVDHGEIAKVIRMLPMELRDLWPLLAQLDAAQVSS